MDKTLPQWESRIGRRLRLRDLHILSSVVQWGSMAQAAKHLAMTQPAVSEAIANLEHALSVRLLDRSSRGVLPTLYAQALLKRGDVVFDELRQGIRDIAFLADPTAGEVRLSSAETMVCALLPAAIDSLSRRHPQIVVRVVQSRTETLEYRELRERKIDLVLAVVSQSLVDEDFNIERLYDEPNCIVAGENSRWARRRKVTLAELVNEPWIYPPNQALIDLLAEAFKARGLALPQERVSASSLLLRNHLLATGHFVSVLPHSVQRYNGRRWGLKALPIDLGVKPRAVAIITLKHRTLSPVVQLFIEHVRAVARTIFAPKGAS